MIGQATQIRWELIPTAILAIALSACASDRLWMKPGAGPQQANDDEMNCAASAEGGSGISIGDASATGFGGPTDQFSNRYGCLRSQGYKLVTVTHEESEKLRGLAGAEREAYWRSLQQKYGVAP